MTFQKGLRCKLWVIRKDTKSKGNLYQEWAIFRGPWICWECHTLTIIGKKIHEVQKFSYNVLAINTVTEGIRKCLNYSGFCMFWNMFSDDSYISSRTRGWLSGRTVCRFHEIPTHFTFPLQRREGKGGKQLTLPHMEVPQTLRIHSWYRQSRAWELSS